MQRLGRSWLVSFHKFVKAFCRLTCSTWWEIAIPSCQQWRWTILVGWRQCKYVWHWQYHHWCLSPQCQLRWWRVWRVTWCQHRKSVNRFPSSIFWNLWLLLRPWKDTHTRQDRVHWLELRLRSSNVCNDWRIHAVGWEAWWCRTGCGYSTSRTQFDRGLSIIISGQCILWVFLLAQQWTLTRKGEQVLTRPK